MATPCSSVDPLPLTVTTSTTLLGVEEKNDLKEREAQYIQGTRAHLKKNEKNKSSSSPQLPTADFVRGLFDARGAFVGNDVQLSCAITSKPVLVEFLEKHSLDFKVNPLLYDITFNTRYDDPDEPCECFFLNGCNAIDFLSLIYDHSSENMRSASFFERYQAMLDPIDVKVVKKDPEAIIPNKKRCSDVGYDLTIIKKVKNFDQTTTLYDTGIIVQPPTGYYIEVFPRSSLSKTGFIQTNSVGIIDPNYLDSIKVPLSRICPDVADIQLPFTGFQLIMRKHEQMKIKEVSIEQLSNTSRGLGGFGSTGSVNKHKI